jgi:outer membrane protein assembly factor BamE (lipoprotein component of BamABCDE complex)
MDFDLRKRLLSMKLSKLLVVTTIAVLMAGCSPEINRRGYIAKQGAFAQVSEGMAKSEVEGILGSPSTTASINFQGDSYYYITSITQGRAFLDPVETNREVIAVRFDKTEQVVSTAQYGLADGKIININTRKTVIAGNEFSILKELFRGIGAAPGGNMLGRKF